MLWEAPPIDAHLLRVLTLRARRTNNIFGRGELTNPLSGQPTSWDGDPGCSLKLSMPQHTWFRAYRKCTHSGRVGGVFNRAVRTERIKQKTNLGRGRLHAPSGARGRPRPPPHGFLCPNPVRGIPKGCTSYDFRCARQASASVTTSSATVVERVGDHEVRKLGDPLEVDHLAEEAPHEVGVQPDHVPNRLLLHSDA